ncbi:MAG: hypothetical protein Ct9H300mP28_24810 [Pseudomonadota bacterium]|nr:MAG: hypothetical protein Ct9H300mP28_24810 [Pseudomonadota bacterium]
MIFHLDIFPDDWEHFEPSMMNAIHRMPKLEDAGIQTFFNGPESFTPDNRYILGEAPELKNFFVAAGFNSIGIQSAGGAGKALSEWIVNGHPTMDLSDVDIRRSIPFRSTQNIWKCVPVKRWGSLCHALAFPSAGKKAGGYVNLSCMIVWKKPEPALGKCPAGSVQTGLLKLERSQTTNIVTADKTGLRFPLPNTKQRGTMLAF